MAGHKNFVLLQMARRRNKKIHSGIRTNLLEGNFLSAAVISARELQIRNAFQVFDGLIFYAGIGTNGLVARVLLGKSDKYAPKIHRLWAWHWNDFMKYR